MLEYRYIKTPIGFFKVEAENAKIISVSYKSENLEKEDSDLPILQECEEQIKAYFRGKLKQFTLPLQLLGTDFQNQVWKTLLQIEYAEVVSYKTIARQIHHPKAYRAVGNANAKNPYCLLVPCHRVIAEHGKIGGYAYGIEIKKWLINFEKQNKWK